MHKIIERALLLSMPLLLSASPAFGDNYSCRMQLSKSFESAYKAGKLTALSLNVGYSKFGAGEKKSWKKTILTSKNGMSEAGVVMLPSKNQEEKMKVNCYISAFKEQNAGFITGFRENLDPELKSVYAKVPMF